MGQVITIRHTFITGLCIRTRFIGLGRQPTGWVLCTIPRREDGQRVVRRTDRTEPRAHQHGTTPPPEDTGGRRVFKDGMEEERLPVLTILGPEVMAPQGRDITPTRSGAVPLPHAVISGHDLDMSRLRRERDLGTRHHPAKLVLAFTAPTEQ